MFTENVQTLQTVAELPSDLKAAIEKPSYVKNMRYEIYSFFDGPTLLTKIAKLSKQEREDIANNPIVCVNKVFNWKIPDKGNPYKRFCPQNLVKLTNYFFKIASEV